MRVVNMCERTAYRPRVAMGMREPHITMGLHPLLCKFPLSWPWVVIGGDWEAFQHAGE